MSVCSESSLITIEGRVRLCFQDRLIPPILEASWGQLLMVIIYYVDEILVSCHECSNEDLSWRVCEIELNQVLVVEGNWEKCSTIWRG